MNKLLPMNASDALYGFAAWLTTREENIGVGSHCNAGKMAELVNLFVLENELNSVSTDYPDNIKFPKE